MYGQRGVGHIDSYGAVPLRLLDRYAESIAVKGGTVATTYYYARDGVEFGPVDSTQLRELARTGEFGPEDYVRRDDATKWTVAGDVPGLFAPKTAVAPPPLPPIPESIEEPVPAPPLAAAPPTESTGARIARISLQTLKLIARETRLILGATGAQLLRLFGLGSGAWKKRRLERNLRDAKIRLGRKMFEAEVGDPELRARTQQLNDSIVSIQAANGSIKRAELERTGLYIRLADSDLGPNVPASISHEHAAASQAQTDLLAHQEQQSESRRRLLPPPGPERRRVAAGGVVSLTALFFFVSPMFFGSDSIQPGPPSADAARAGEATAKELVEKARQAVAPSADDLAQSQKLVEQGNAKRDEVETAQGNSDLKGSQRAGGESIRLYDRAIELTPAHVDAYLQRGRLLLALEDYTGSLRDFTVVTELDPQLPEAWSYRSLVYAILLEYDKAIADADRAIELKYEQPLAHYSRGTSLMSKGEYNEAVGSLSTAISMNNITAVYFVDRSNCYLELGDVNSAYNDATQAIQLDPNESMAYNNRAAALLGAERYADALTDLNQAIRLNANHALFLANRALAHWGLDNARQAVQDGEASIAADPNVGRAYMIRAAAYEISDRLDEAMADLEKAESLGSNDALLYLTRGNILFKQRRYQQALADYDRMIELTPNWRRAHKHRGECHAAMGNRALAEQDFAQSR